MLPFSENDHTPRLPRETPRETERETLPPPTVPMPRMSEVRIRMNHVNGIVELVTADLQLDPRSEEFIGGPELVPTPRPRMALPPKPLCSLPAPSRDLPQAPLASDTYFTKPQRGDSDARHLPSIRVRMTKQQSAKKAASSKKSA